MTKVADALAQMEGMLATGRVTHPLQDKLDALAPDARAVAWELAYALRDAEREACAKIAEEYGKRAWGAHPSAQEAAVGAGHIAAAIRARGKG